MPDNNESDLIGGATPVRKATRAEGKQRQKPERFNFGTAQQKMQGYELPGYHLHWVNDKPGRVDEAQLDGYEFVLRDEVHVKQGFITGNAALGDRIARTVGLQDTGTEPMLAYLMKIPLDWYEEKQGQQQQVNDRVDSAILDGNNQNGIDPNRRYKADGISVKTSFRR